MNPLGTHTSLVVMGGYPNYNIVEEYILSEKSWQKLANLPRLKDDFASCVVDVNNIDQKYIVVLGGCDHWEGKACCETDIYCKETNTGKHVFDVTMHQGKLYTSPCWTMHWDKMHQDNIGQFDFHKQQWDIVVGHKSAHDGCVLPKISIGSTDAWNRYVKTR